jgi:hypothetical protein
LYSFCLFICFELAFCYTSFFLLRVPLTLLLGFSSVSTRHREDEERIAFLLQNEITRVVQISKFSRILKFDFLAENRFVIRCSKRLREWRSWWPSLCSCVSLSIQTRPKLLLLMALSWSVFLTVFPNLRFHFTSPPFSSLISLKENDFPLDLYFLLLKLIDINNIWKVLAD